MKTVLVTGNTGNVGNACVRYVRARSQEWELRGISRSYNFDLTDWDDTAAWVGAHSAPFNLVIMTHGVQDPCFFAGMTGQDWNNIIENNLSSAASLTAALIQECKIAIGGLIVYFSSIQATQPRAGRAPYAAAKAGIEGLMRAAAVEIADLGARAVALRIGQMTTPMQGIQFGKDEMDYIKKRIPGPLVDPDDIARLCFQLYEQPSLNGEVIEVSSGHAFNIW